MTSNVLQLPPIEDLRSLVNGESRKGTCSLPGGVVRAGLSVLDDVRAVMTPRRAKREELMAMVSASLSVC